MTRKQWPVAVTNCADCGVGTVTLGEWYWVHKRVWEQAWVGRLKSWHDKVPKEVLCIGCVEQRLGRTLIRRDFPNAPINDPDETYMSDRLLERLL